MNVTVGVRIEIDQGINNLFRFLGGSPIIEIGQWFTVGSLFKDGEVASDGTNRIHGIRDWAGIVPQALL